MKRIYIPLFFFFFSIIYADFIHATVFTSIADGDWDEIATWDQGSLPGPLDTVIIEGHSVTINIGTGNVTVKRIKIVNRIDSCDFSVNGLVTLTVSDDFVVSSQNKNYNIEVRLLNGAIVNVGGDVDFRRTNGNTADTRLKLNISQTSRMNVSGDFTYDYNNAAATETFSEVALNDSAILDVTGNTYFYLDGGKKFRFDIGNSSQAILRGDLYAEMTGGTDTLVIKNRSILTIGGNVTLISTAADKKVVLELIENTSVTTVSGNFTMSAVSEGDVFIDLNGTSNLYIAGNFLRPTNFGALLMDPASTLTYDGTSAQEIAKESLPGGGTDAFNYTNVVLDNATGFALTDTMFVTENLDLTNGIITTTSTNILIIGDSATITGGNASNYIDGPMIKEGRTNGDQFVFPIGDGSLYAPMEITKISSSGSEYMAQYFGDPPPFGTSIAADVDNISGYQYWELSKIAGSDDVEIKLHWMDAAANGINNLDSLIVVGLNVSNIWENFGNGGTTGGTGSGISGSISSTDGDPPPFGVTKFTIGETSPDEGSRVLPVELMNFRANKKGEKVYLNWQTASEINTRHFEVERSFDGINFERIGIIHSKGDSEIIQNYSVIDAVPNMGSNYYRLKIVDFDGYYEYSRMREMSFEQNRKLKIYPNPVNEQLHIQGDNSLNEEGVFEVFNTTGQRIYVGKYIFIHGRLKISIDEINAHAPGTYFIRITTSIGSHQLRIIRGR